MNINQVDLKVSRVRTTDEVLQMINEARRR